MGMDCKAKSHFVGVRYREHATRKKGIRKDKYYFIRYKIAGKVREEGYGWESEGFTEKGAFDVLCAIKRNIKEGHGFFSLKEKREEEDKRRVLVAKQEALDKKKNLTFGDVYENYYRPDYLNQKPVPTQKNELALYKKYVEGVLANKKLIDITPADLEKIKVVMQGRAPATINHALAFVRQVFNAAKNAKVFAGENPVSSVRKMKSDNRRIRFLSRQEAAVLLEAIKKKSEQMYQMSLLSLYSGLRAGEIFKLKWADIDIERRRITVRDPKSSVNRFAYMTDALQEIFIKKKTTDFNPDCYVFTRGGKQTHRITEVSDTFKRAVEDVGLNKGITDRRQKVVFHTLRHTYASWLVQAGVSLYEVQVLMGHSNISMTQRYSHLAPDNFKKAIAAIEKQDVVIK